MKIEGKTIPAPQNIKRREAYLLQNADKLPKTSGQAQLLKIAMIRTQKKLRWETPQIAKAPIAERINKPSSDFKIESRMPKQTFFGRVKGMFKAQRGQ